MDKDLNKILKTLGVKDGDYYINEEGRVKKKEFLLDEDTGIYQTESGEFKKDGFLLDEKTGLKQNKRGEFKEEGVLFDKDTGIYQDKDGNYRKKGFLFDEKTGYYKDKEGNIKKEGVFRDTSHINTRSSNSKDYSPPEDEVSETFRGIKWIFLLSLALLVIILAVFSAPLIFLIWYLIKKRQMQWIAIVGMIFTIYLIYDISNYGFISSMVNKMMNFSFGKDKKYVLIGYFTILVTTLGFYLDKYTSSKIPISENGNFFEKKNIKERRPFITGLSILLLIGFSIFQFVDFSNNSSHSLKSNDINYNKENTNNEINTSNNSIVNKPINNQVTTTYKGKIKTYPITMEIKFMEGFDCKRGGTSVEGHYYYNKSGKNNKLRLTGYTCGASIFMEEKNSKNEVTGIFNGIINGDNIKGQWTNEKNEKKLDFELLSTQ